MQQQAWQVAARQHHELPPQIQNDKGFETLAPDHTCVVTLLRWETARHHIKMTAGHWPTCPTIERKSSRECETNTHVDCQI